MTSSTNIPLFSAFVKSSPPHSGRKTRKAAEAATSPHLTGTNRHQVLLPSQPGGVPATGGETGGKAEEKYFF